MLTRRDALRTLSLAALAVAAPGLLAGCSGRGTEDDGNTGEVGGRVTGTEIELVSSDVQRAVPDPAAVAAGVAAISGLGAGLYRELGEVPGNLAISPYSVAVALGMTLNGARGTTLAEMLRVLGAESADSLNAGLNAATQHVESLAGPVPHRKDEEIALDAANSLFGQRGVTWDKRFLDALAAYYGAGMRQVDYERAAEAARKVINGWTAEQTNDRIEEIIPAGVLTAITRLVLVNTLYFKAPWDDPFDKEATSDGAFHLADGDIVDVPMMRKTISARPGAGAGWASVTIPYAGDTLGMTVVLPEGDLGSVETLVTTGRLEELLPTGPPGQVDLTMPTFTFRSAAQLAAALADLGMPTAFTDAADFGGMTAEAALQISDVLHQVFIAVDEKGTEAAAATAVVMRLSSLPRVDLTLVLDRPFLFVIHDLEHRTPLFVGRVADPR